MTAILMPAVLGLVALAIDFGYASVRQRVAQNAADAAALGAAYQVGGGSSESDATHTASLLATQAGYQSSQVTISFLDGSGNPTGTADRVASVNARVVDTVPTFFMRVLGINSSQLAASAIAAVFHRTPCSLCVMDPSASGALSGNGNPSLSVNGNVIVNSSSPSAISLTGHPSVTAQGIKVVGGVAGGGSLSPAPVTGVAPIPDPFAGLPVPNVAGPDNGSSSGGDSRTLSPGIYSSISASDGAVVTLAPGIYVVTGSISLGGHAQLNAAGVMLYLACSAYPSRCATGQAGAGLSTVGTTGIALTAPDSSTCAAVASTCPYVGVALFADRNSTAALGISGTGTGTFAGAIYGRSATLGLTGSGQGLELDAAVAVGSVSFSGNGTIQILAPSPGAGSFSLPYLIG